MLRVCKRCAPVCRARAATRARPETTARSSSKATRVGPGPGPAMTRALIELSNNCIADLKVNRIGRDRTKGRELLTTSAVRTR